MSPYDANSGDVIFLIPKHVNDDCFFQNAIAVLSNGDTLEHNGAFWFLLAGISYFNGKTYAEEKARNGATVISGKIRLK